MPKDLHLMLIGLSEILTPSSCNHQSGEKTENDNPGDIKLGEPGIRSIVGGCQGDGSSFLGGRGGEIS
jgi:hypothetical protein